MMTNLDRFMEILLAGIFLLIGAWQIVSYGRRPKSLGAGHRALPLGLPYGLVIVVGLVEIVAALGLVVPFGPIPPERLALVAAIGLALLTLTAAIYRTRRQQSAVPSTMLFLMALFIILGHTV
jgi:di/tricarboxylate transporter